MYRPAGGAFTCLKRVDAVKPNTVWVISIWISVRQRCGVPPGIPLLTANSTCVTPDAGVQIDDEAHLGVDGGVEVDEQAVDDE